MCVAPPDLNGHNSAHSMCQGASASELLLAYNPTTSKRTPLSLAASTDAGRTWRDTATLDR